jgi:hypothetical protein
MRLWWLVFAEIKNISYFGVPMHVREGLQERIDYRARILDVDKHIHWQGQEGIINVRYNNTLWKSQRRLQSKIK